MFGGHSVVMEYCQGGVQREKQALDAATVVVALPRAAAPTSRTVAISVEGAVPTLSGGYRWDFVAVHTGGDLLCLPQGRPKPHGAARQHRPLWKTP